MVGPKRGQRRQQPRADPGRRRDEFHALPNHAAQLAEVPRQALRQRVRRLGGDHQDAVEVDQQRGDRALTYSSAHNTDGIDPGESASNGYIVCSNITDGDDHIAIKGSSSTGVTKLTIAHNHFEAGHGISIGSEFTGGVSEIKVYDISIDQIGTGTGGGSSNGLRIKSDSSRGGLVNNVTYSDVCMRGVANPIFLTPTYSSSTGSYIPHYTNITFSNIHVLTGGNSPTVTLDGYSSSDINSVTLDNVIFDLTPNLTASYTNVTLGPGNVTFTPSGTGVTVSNKVSGASTPNPCTNKWVTF